MKVGFVILVFSFASFRATSQASIDTVRWRQRIFNEIKDYEQIDHYGWSIPKQRQKADSLFKKMPLDISMAYINEKNHAIKYYAFLRIMDLNDSLAFEYLKSYISDTTYVSGSAACMGWDGKFNEVITSEYKTFISYKYKGQSFSVDHRAYIFTGKNRKLEKKKLKQFYDLIQLNKLNLKNL